MSSPAVQPAPRSAACGGLSEDQAQAAVMLARGGTVTAAADAIRVHRSTIYNWFKSDPSFQTAIEEIRRERRERLIDEMTELESLALASVRRALEDPSVPPSVKLRAALAVLNRSLTQDGMESWRLPHMRPMQTLGRPVGKIAEPPQSAIVQRIAEVVAQPPASPAPDAAPEQRPGATRQTSTQPAAFRAAATSTTPPEGPAARRQPRHNSTLLSLSPPKSRPASPSPQGTSELTGRSLESDERRPRTS